MSLVQGFTLASVGLRKDVRLLVVDDHAEQYEQLKDVADMYSPEFKIECKLATTEEEAKNLTSTWQPTVVLVDLHLVNSEALALLKQLSEFGTPVVATSVERVPDIEQTAQDYGAVGYVPKGETVEELETLVTFVASVAGPLEESH